MWNANIRPHDIFKLIEAHSFWADVWVAWSKMTREEPTHEKYIPTQQLWLNSAIKIKNKPIYWKKWIDLNVMYIQDLCEHGSLMTYNQIRQKYGDSVNYLEYRSIIAANPKDWKNSLDQKENQQKTRLERYMEHKSIVKMVYHELNASPLLLKPILMKWGKQNLNFTVSCERLTWEINKIKKITNYVKLRSFQYRLLCCAIITNTHLFKFKIKSTNLCTFCDIEEESYEHLFFSCQCVRRFWNQILEWLSIDSSQFTFETVLYNDVKPNPNFVENSIVLQAKHYIYKQRCAEESLNFVYYKNCV